MIAICGMESAQFMKVLLLILMVSLLLEKNTLADDLGPDVLVPLNAVLDNYWKGKVSNEDLSLYVDRVVAQVSDPMAKAEVLQRVAYWLPGRVVPNHDYEGLIIQYSKELSDVSCQPDVVSEAMLRNAVANEHKADVATGGDRNAHLLSALKSWITVSKIIAANLEQREKIPSPGVGGYLFDGDTNSPEYLALMEKHDAEKEMREYVDQQNDLLSLSKPVKDGMERVKGELSLSDEQFSKIWMEVKAKKFNEFPGVFRFDRH